MSERVRAAAAGQQGWGQHGDAAAHRRYQEPSATPRRRCRREGCTNKAAFVGCCNGLAMISGCEFHVRQWVSAGSS